MDLFQIIRRGDLGQFKSSSHGVDLDVVNEFGQTPLHEAVVWNPDIGRELIKRGVNVNARDNNGQTPLHYAVIHRKAAMAREILDHGGDVAVKDKYGNGPLWNAVFHAKGDYRLVEMLLSRGADPNNKNNSQKSPLDFARTIKDQRLIELLTE